MALPGAARWMEAALGGGETETRSAAGPAPGSPPDRRFAYARDAAITSYRNRYGREPSEAELQDAMPHYMTQRDREAYAQERAAGSAILARGLPAPPLGRPLRPAPPRPSPVMPVVPAPDAAPSSGLHPYLDAMVKSGRGLAGAYMMPAALIAGIVQRMVEPPAEPDSPPDLALLERPVRWGVEALRAQVAAYDRYKTDPRKSYQTYTKEREDLGPCRYGEKSDPNTPCYYAGRTGGILEPNANVDWRNAARYPAPSYYEPRLDCSTRSYAVARGREQQLIQHFRDLGYSDNLINSVADHVWRPYFMELAKRECGHRAMPEPKPR